MKVGIPGWTGRTDVQRVRLYTLGSLYLLYWLLLGMGWLGAANEAGTVRTGAVLLVISLVVGVLGVINLREAIRLYPAQGPVPWGRFAALVVGCAASAVVIAVTVPESAGLGGVLIAMGTLAWGAGGLRDQRVQWAIWLLLPLMAFVVTGQLALAAFGLAFGLFFVFTVQSSLWLLGVVTELDEARGTQAALAVAEERLRFSRDVHDVLGRQLSTIAVQAELASTLARRGDASAADRILEVRTSAHEALREARELARGYRPLDLHTEVEGAVALLRSAGIEADADLAGLPEAWHEPAARLIREAVTNVIRHSRARRVTMSYDDLQLVIRNDGVGDPTTAQDGSGLRTLTEDLAPLGARLTARREGEEFVVRLEMSGAAQEESA